ncbi:hypothetical protein LY78DRAFT_95550 [Colletotrichum sublineola]|nr:hypothetical protein LY78DRAFT_95550 [Colletotrichum sublineola]
MATAAGITLTVADISQNLTLDGLTAAIRQSTPPPNCPIDLTAYCGPVEQSFAQGRLCSWRSSTWAPRGI